MNRRRVVRKPFVVAPIAGKTNWLVGSAYDPGVTRMDRGVIGYAPRQDGSLPTRNGPTRANGVPFTTVAGQVLIIAATNPYRTGLFLQNKDAVADLFYSFGQLADVTAALLPPRTSILLDFVCPTDQVSVFSVAANITGYYADMSPSMGS